MNKNRKNRIVLTILGLITIGIFLTYCIKKGFYTFEKIKIEPVNIVEAAEAWKNLGITKCVETSNAKYYVHSSMNLSDDEITDYVNNSELMFKSAKDELDIPIDRFEIEFSDKLSNSNYKIKYNPHDKNAEGIVFSSIGNGKLPTWLCVGLERHYKEKYDFQKYDYDKFDMVDWLKSSKENKLPNFGDYWFVKDFFMEDAKEKACIISHRFVDYLAKENHLKDIVNSYCNGEKDSFTTTEDQFNKFLKTTNVNITNEVLYTYNNMVITKPKAIYTIENGVETWDTLSGDIDFMEKGMLYIEDTFGRKFNKKVDVSIYSGKDKDLRRGGFANGRNITLYNERFGINNGAIHEMTHAYFNDEGGDINSRRILTEGLCNYIASKYDGLKSDYRRNDDEQILAQAEQTAPNDKSTVDKIMYYYNKFDNDNDDDYDNTYDFISRAMYDASAAYELFDVGFGKGRNTDYYIKYFKNGAYDDIQFIESYETSTSFVYYLLEEEIDLDDFLLLMEDLDEYNRQNDKTLSELVDNWLNYLEQAIK